VRESHTFAETSVVQDSLCEYLHREISGSLSPETAVKTIPAILFGTVLQSMQLNAGYVTKLHDFGTPLGNIGIYPNVSVIARPDGTLYGTTNQGGPNDVGSVYSLQTNGACFTHWNFTGNADGAFPASKLVLCNSTLFGTANLCTFADELNAGAVPYGALALYGGSLFGTTDNGGIYPDGTVFSVDRVPPLQITQVRNSPVVHRQSDDRNHTLQSITKLSARIWTNAPALNWTNGTDVGLQPTHHSASSAAFLRLKLSILQS
jgi:uncharacterized repeat protein (TIGR03803 family)